MIDKDVLQVAKMAEALKEKEKDENFKRAVKIILIIVGAVTIVAGIGYVIYKFLNREEDYDFYDDLDNYYDEDDEDDIEIEDEEEESEEEEANGEEAPAEA